MCINNIYLYTKVYEHVYRNLRPRRPLYRSTMYTQKGLVALEEKRRRGKMPSLARQDNGTGISWLLPPHLHTYTRIRTCHVLLLLVTIIVTTGIVFVVKKVWATVAFHRKKKPYRNLKKKMCILKFRRCYRKFFRPNEKYHLQTLTTIALRNNRKKKKKLWFLSLLLHNVIYTATLHHSAQ